MGKPRKTPFSLGRIYYIPMDTFTGHTSDPPCTLVNISKTRTNTAKLCTQHWDRTWLESHGFTGYALKSKLKLLGDELPRFVTHEFLRTKGRIIASDIPTEREPDGMGPQESCCRCHKPTPFWTLLPDRKPGDQIPLCRECSPKTHPDQIPSKAAYCQLERTLNQHWTPG